LHKPTTTIATTAAAKQTTKKKTQHRSQLHTHPLETHIHKVKRTHALPAHKRWGRQRREMVRERLALAIFFWGLRKNRITLGDVCMYACAKLVEKKINKIVFPNIYVCMFVHGYIYEKRMRHKIDSQLKLRGSAVKVRKRRQGKGKVQA